MEFSKSFLLLVFIKVIDLILFLYAFSLRFMKRERRKDHLNRPCSKALQSYRFWPPWLGDGVYINKKVAWWRKTLEMDAGHGCCDVPDPSLGVCVQHLKLVSQALTHWHSLGPAGGIFKFSYTLKFNIFCLPAHETYSGKLYLKIQSLQAVCSFKYLSTQVTVNEVVVSL